MIPPIVHEIGEWTLRITDNGKKLKDNPIKYYFDETSRSCRREGCGKKLRANSRGMCDTHQIHEHDLLLVLEDDSGNKLKVPAHKNIIDCLLEWSRPRNFDLIPFFEDISFSILGNVPDVTSMAKKVRYDNITVPSLQDVFDNAIGIAEKYFPESNKSSFQTLKVKDDDIPIIVLSHIFIALTVCEEANRGDRWYHRHVMGNESETEMLGGAMAIAYFAAVSFRWGMELGKASRKLT